MKIHRFSYRGQARNFLEIMICYSGFDRKLIKTYNSHGMLGHAPGRLSLLFYPLLATSQSTASRHEFCIITSCDGYRINWFRYSHEYYK